MIALHLRRRTLLAFDAHELGGRATKRARSHLARCPRCRSRLIRLRALRTAAAEVTAPAAPDVLQRIGDRLRSGEIVLLPVPDARGSGQGARGRATRRSLTAAGMALALLAGSVAAAIAIPPVREWFRSHVVLGGAPTPEPVEPMSGVALPLGRAGFVIDVQGASPDVMIRMSRGSSELLDIVGVGATATARYRSARGRLTVVGLLGGALRVLVPSEAGTVALVSGSDTLVVADAGGLRMPDGSVVPRVDVRLGDLLPGGSKAPEDAPASGEGAR